VPSRVCCMMNERELVVGWEFGDRFLNRLLCRLEVTNEPCCEINIGSRSLYKQGFSDRSGFLCELWLLTRLDLTDYVFY
jgi:hypothetical protein